ncbi:hypothetical protein E3N88_39213 [Mikania micrantha]|uniref:Uncharacterized protein n=1 Tax=Mikania micrantha TaxID=192012 RepID=A0A5N6LW62_9ASTR|nr:hypothetical protein E3N88_39213 [Mikania micrantha]
METVAVLRSSFATCIGPSIRPDFGRSRNGSIAFATGLNKQGFPSFSHLRSVSFQTQKKRSAIRASSSFDSAGPTARIAPLQLESPIGQFLSQILISHPHLVPAAVEQQLEQLQTDRDAEKQNEEPSALSTDLVLYRRIAEVKANERKKALEEILYTLVVQKFVDANISLIPTEAPQTHPEVTSWSELPNSGPALKPSRLRNYVMSFEPELLQRYAAIRSKEAVNIIEKHTEALFGKPEIVITPEGTIDSSKDEVINISFGGLRRLVLEAVTFGSFLWDVESYVDSRYHFVAT